MSYRDGVIVALRDWGLKVVETAGWSTRGDPDFDPRGHILHHDVIAHTERLPQMLITGRPDLAGPLCNFWLTRSGVVHCVAAGEANHAGSGGWKGLSGNSSVWGTEMNNLGTPDDPWPVEQLDAMALLARATADYSGFDTGYVAGHKEWAPDRKIDPHTIDMSAFRTQVALQEKRQEFSIVDDKTKEYLDTKFRIIRDRDRVILENEKRILKKLGVADADLKEIDEQLDRIEKEVA